MARKRKKGKLKGFIPWKVVVVPLVILMILISSIIGYILFSQSTSQPTPGCCLHVTFEAGLFDGEGIENGGGWAMKLKGASGGWEEVSWEDVKVEVIRPDGDTIVEWKGIGSKKSDLVFKKGDDRILVRSRDIEEVTFENEDGTAKLVDRYDELDFDEILTVSHAKVIIYDNIVSDTDITISVHDWLFVFRDSDMDGNEEIPVNSKLRIRLGDNVRGAVTLCDCPVSDYLLTVTPRRFDPNSTLTLNGGGWWLHIEMGRGFWGMSPSFAWANISMVADSSSDVEILAFDSLNVDNATISFLGLDEAWYLYGKEAISFDDAGSLTPLNNATKDRIVTIEFISLENVTVVIFDNNGNGLMDNGDRLLIFRDSDADGVQDVGPSSSVTLYHKGEIIYTLILS